MSDIILTNYRGVNVTPYTFNNLIKTIANYKSVSNISSSKSDYDERIRGIILACNPALKKDNTSSMTTEHMLITSLKKNDITHTYNYNTWNDKQYDNTNYTDDNDDDDYKNENNSVINHIKIMANSDWSDDKLLDLFKSLSGKKYSQQNKKLKKKYIKYIKQIKNNNTSDESNLLYLKRLLNVDHLDIENCGILINALKDFLKKCTNSEQHNTVDKYIYALRETNETLKKLQEENNKFKKNNNCDKLEKQINELKNKAKSLEEQYDNDKKNYIIQINNLNSKVAAQTNKIDTQNDNLSQNIIDMAQLGANLGEKEALIEELQNTYLSETDKLNQDKSLLETNINILDKKNDELLVENSLLKSKIEDLNRELGLKQTEIETIKNTCYNTLNEKQKSDNDNNLCYQTTIKQLSDEKNKLETDIKEMKNEYIIALQQLQTNYNYKQSELEHKEQELNICINRIKDNESAYILKTNEFTNLINETNNLKNIIILEHQKLQLENEKLKEQLETTNKEVNVTELKYNALFKKKKDDDDDNCQIITQLRNENEAHKREKSLLENELSKKKKENNEHEKYKLLVQKANDVNESLKKEITDLKKNNTQLQKQADAYYNDGDNAIQEKTMLQKKLKQLQNENEILSNDLKTKENEVSLLKEETQQEINTLKKFTDTAALEKIDLIKKINLLEQQLLNLQKSNTDSNVEENITIRDENKTKKISYLFKRNSDKLFDSTINKPQTSRKRPTNEEMVVQDKQKKVNAVKPNTKNQTN
ncbi:desmoplakin [Choristoneura occidentalis granulovirus]|uniref:Desmoplakin n=1 Tax=Choristoneura occidentalis granulovirus TaxID=364745 RepID=Q1A4K5_9BBAC|nr:desmoplakin [Choristoneura fumiferana granulovirus]ABC61225.1 desmoplakin [Choristoneura fumiferana granulovirus]